LRENFPLLRAQAEMRPFSENSAEEADGSWITFSTDKESFVPSDIE
jgi:hypothetical protein